MGFSNKRRNSGYFSVRTIAVHFFFFNFRVHQMFFLFCVILFSSIFVLIHSYFLVSLAAICDVAIVFLILL